MEPGRWRHKVLPQRDLSDSLIVARPLDGAPVFLGATAAVVWRQLRAWCTTAQLEQRLADVYPMVPSDSRSSALDEILDSLLDDDLVDTSS